MKLKTKKGVVKRFKLTKKKKIRYRPGGKSHLLSAKESKRKRQMRRSRFIKGAKEKKYLRRLLPYG
ncbi:MAG: 50S ribosomal protein L35 [Candidatus Omnitrophica bacterium]|nr:50S ribosomal protein L35 [Candidatus Omnitrophota bacterium]MCM8771001.1 50S ribosomal protein L35 [Candidatus Omnitrophota bacterium]